MDNQSLILERVEQALNDVEVSTNSHLKGVTDVLESIAYYETKIKECKKELGSAIDKICGDLAMTIRKMQPKLIVTIQNGGCIIGYRTKSIVCKVDPLKKEWDFSFNEFGKIFAKRNPSCTHLGCDLEDMAKRIADFFNHQYTSLAVGL